MNAPKNKSSRLPGSPKKRGRRWALRIVGGIFCVLLLAWILVDAYILLNKQPLLKKARTELNKRTGGDVNIGDIDISLFRNFPEISLHLSKVSLRDSLWQQHHHDLLQAENIFIRFSFFSLFSSHPRVDKIYLQQGAIYLFTDSTGYSNTAALKKLGQGNTNKTPQKEVNPPDISLDNIRFTLDKQDLHKLFDFDIRHLDCPIEKDSRSLQLQVDMDVKVNSFTFNTEKGSFLKNKILSGKFRLLFNTASHIIQGDKLAIRIDGHPFLLSGRFFPDVSPDPFSITIQTSDILYRQATALLTPALQQKLDQYDIDKPISLNAGIDAGSADDHEPLLNIRMALDKGAVTTPVGRFTDASFTGAFINEWIKGHKREDENSGLRFHAFSGKWNDITVTADTITITNLRRPLLACDLHSGFDLKILNDLAGSSTIQFSKGSAALNVLFRGPLSKEDSTSTEINGTLDLDTAAVTYLPYKLLLADCSGRLRFKDQDFFIDHLEAHTGSSKILLKGTVKNLVSLLDKSPESLQVDCSVSSPRLDLHDIISVAGQPEATLAAQQAEKRPFSKTSTQIDRLLKDGTIHILLEATNLSYQHFSGAHAKAELFFRENEIRLINMLVEQEIGSISFAGKIHRQPGKAGNPLSIVSHIDQADISRIFASFNNFGQQGLVSKNLKGKLTADIVMNGRLTDKAVLVQNSLKGTVNFNLTNGQLINYEPIEKINESVLKKRDLSEIRFAELKNQLDVDTTTVYVHRMEIQSTAVTLFLEGQYDWKKGADFSIQVPLSNLKKRDQDAAPENKGTDSKTGISVHLRAKTGDDGKLKISWDPFKKALKTTKKKN
jgi:AsmA-like C-terminal region